MFVILRFVLISIVISVCGRCSLVMIMWVFVGVLGVLVRVVSICFRFSC